MMTTHTVYSHTPYKPWIILRVRPVQLLLSVRSVSDA